MVMFCDGVYSFGESFSGRPINLGEAANGRPCHAPNSNLSGSTWVPWPLGVWPHVSSCFANLKTSWST